MTSNGIVLLVEDNEKLNTANSRALSLGGYEVHTAITLAEARKRLADGIEPDVILLDIMLPDGDGFDFCNAIRGETNAHIIFLTALAQHTDRVRGLHTGGDDYITKPFHPEELMARIVAAMRRRGIDKTSVKTIEKGCLTLDIISAQAFAQGSDLNLTPKEFALLLMLVQNEGSTMSAEYIYESVWKAPLIGDNNALKTAISKLRSKIEATGFDITSHRGRGYVFQKIQR